MNKQKLQNKRRKLLAKQAKDRQQQSLYTEKLQLIKSNDFKKAFEFVASNTDNISLLLNLKLVPIDYSYWGGKDTFKNLPIEHKETFSEYKKLCDEHKKVMEKFRTFYFNQSTNAYIQHILENDKHNNAELILYNLDAITKLIK